ncbi:MAG: hypothetical protein ACNA7J_09535 [Wenzhouxiangella sp.]
MITHTPFWKRPLMMLLLIGLAVSGGAWLALDRPMPEQWQGADGRPELRMPEFLRTAEPDRLYCAESSDTGICRCITTGGTRPDIPNEECRRRARESLTE